MAGPFIRDPMTLDEARRITARSAETSEAMPERMEAWRRARAAITPDEQHDRDGPDILRDLPGAIVSGDGGS